MDELQQPVAYPVVRPGAGRERGHAGAAAGVGTTGPPGAVRGGRSPQRPAELHPPAAHPSGGRDHSATECALDPQEPRILSLLAPPRRALSGRGPPDRGTGMPRRRGTGLARCLGLPDSRAEPKRGKHRQLPECGCDQRVGSLCRLDPPALPVAPARPRCRNPAALGIALESGVRVEPATGPRQRGGLRPRALMEASRPWRRPQVLVALLALAASAASLANGFVYDDIPIVMQNPLVHHAEMVGQIWTTPYWPAGLLYRPLTMQGFALQWAAGAGSPIVFHATSVLLMVLLALLFWRLARRILPEAPAFLGSALFAVHPVHVESVANAVGQAELLATALTLLALERYLAWRVGGPLGAPRRAALAVLTLLAILSKETGFVIPALLLGAEVLLVAPRGPWRTRLGVLAPVLVLQGAAVVVAVLARIIVLGPTPGAGPAVALQGLRPGERVAGMLAVVPEWARLLLWPAHLQAEYGPPAIPVTGPIGPAHVIGAGLLLAALGILLITWRRHPVIAFGLSWVGIALFPVSNVLTSTGVILAERTLFLPSAGAM